MRYPNFYDEGLSSSIYLPRYQKIAKEAEQYKIPLSNTTIQRNALLVIDAQIGFCMKGASLYVPNAERDVSRICEFIYRNMGNLSTLFFSLDTHYTYQIFYPSFWIDENKKHPKPFTIITYQDILDGKWIPVMQQEYAVSYVMQLEATGKYNLCIWDYHTMMGSIDHSLVSILSETAFFHSLVKNKATEFVLKGEHMMTESYSAFSPEVKIISKEHGKQNVGCFDSNLFYKLMDYDKVFIAGEASSHCVKSTIEDLLDKIKEVNAKLVDKIYILEDCMSPVPAIPNVVDFPAIAQQALNSFKEAGVHVIKGTEL